MPKKVEQFTLREVALALEGAYGKLAYPRNLLSTWPSHLPMFVRLPGGHVGSGWLSRVLMEADEGKQVLALLPSHMETRNVQKALSRCSGALFLSRRLNADDWSEGVVLIGLNIEIKPGLARYGIIMKPLQEVVRGQGQGVASAAGEEGGRASFQFPASAPG